MIYEQYGRVYSLQIGTMLIDELDLSFTAVRTLEKEPNTLELTIYNLSPTRRAQIQKNPINTVQLTAGYTSKTGVIFFGDLREGSSVYEKPDWVTTLSSGDGEKSTQKSRVNKSFGAGTSLTTVLAELAESMPGVSVGNLKQMIARGKLPSGSMEFPEGVTISGNGPRELERIMKSAGLEWSIQDGAFQVLEAAKSLSTTAIVLTPETGVIGSPTLASDGTLNIVTLLNSDIIPGKQLVVTTRMVVGRFRAERVTYKGDTRGRDWYCEIEAKEL